MAPSIAVCYVAPELKIKAHALAKQLGLPVDNSEDQYDFTLQLTHERLQLCAPKEKRFNPISVDFLDGTVYHRYRFGGGKGQLIAKAVGLSKAEKPLKILDVTAGLGRDAFVLASLGADVLMLERSTVLVALLEDGLQRASQADWFQPLTLELTQANAIEYLLNVSAQTFDVIYLDPMFPLSKNTALVKKEMRVLRELVGTDDDADQLLTMALNTHVKRVVVKRARYAPALAGPKVDLMFNAKSSRYDVYLNRK